MFTSRLNEDNIFTVYFKINKKLDLFTVFKFYFKENGKWKMENGKSYFL